MQISLIIGTTVSIIVLVTGMFTAFAFRTHDTGGAVIRHCDLDRPV